jgi:N-acetylmuramoyl-L-alanine amidase
MKILVDNGHGIDTAGKRSPDAVKNMFSSPLYFREYKWCRELACMVCDILQAEGYDASLLVPEINDIPLEERCRRANKFDKNNTILVSIHNNAAGSGSEWMTARGWSIFTTRGITKADILAECIWQRAKTAFKAPLTVRAYSNTQYGHDFENDFTIIKKSYCPAVLIENFFQDNREDVRYLNTDIGKATCAEVIVDGIKDYLKK